jgi:hypothetical protein
VRRRNKYGAAKAVVDGIVFQSKAEANRYAQLKLLSRAKKISSLALQPVYSIDIEGFHICNYIADFRYFDNERSKEIVEDVKGVKTAVYRLKKKLVEATHRITIEEILV